ITAMPVAWALFVFARVGILDRKCTAPLDIGGCLSESDRPPRWPTGKEIKRRISLILKRHRSDCWIAGPVIVTLRYLGGMPNVKPNMNAATAPIMPLVIMKGPLDSPSQPPRTAFIPAASSLRKPPSRPRALHVRE